MEPTMRSHEIREIQEILGMTYGWIGKKYAACPLTVSVAALRATYPAIIQGENAIEKAALAHDLPKVKELCRAWCKTWGEIIDAVVVAAGKE